MSIHRFGQSEQVGPDRFDSVLKSFRSDVEQLHPPVQLHDEESPDLKYARLLADEVVNVSGANVKIYFRTNNHYDKVFDEDADPTYYGPILLKAFFKPQPLEMELEKFGSQIDNKAEIVFSHRHIHERFGDRMLRPGDVIDTPYNAAAHSPKYYKIENAQPTGNYRYHWLYLTCQVVTLDADISIRPLDDLPPSESDIDGGEFYRETL